MSSAENFTQSAKREVVRIFRVNTIGIGLLRGLYGIDRNAEESTRWSLNPCYEY